MFGGSPGPETALDTRLGSGNRCQDYDGMIDIFLYSTFYVIGRSVEYSVNYKKCGCQLIDKASTSLAFCSA